MIMLGFISVILMPIGVGYMFSLREDIDSHKLFETVTRQNT